MDKLSLNLQSNDEVLGFIKDFERSSHEYLCSKGLTEHEYASAYLDLQWKFLHTVLRRETPSLRPRTERKRVLRKSS